MVSGRGVSLTLRSRELMCPGGSAQALRGAGFGLTRPRSLGSASSSPGTGPKAAAGGGTTEWSGRSWKCPSLLPCASRAQQTLLFFRTSSVKDSSFVEKMKKTVSFLFVLGPGGCAGASSRRPASLAGKPTQLPVCVLSGLTRASRLLCCCWDSLLRFLRVCFSNKPNCKNRPSL